MKSATLSRLTALLAEKKLDRTVTAAWMEAPAPVVASGISDVDAALGGGWRCGELSELVGPASSGRTLVLQRTLAQVTRQGQVAALVDSLDRFDPVSAVELGVDLQRVLWVRGPAMTVDSRRPALLDQAVRYAVRAFDLIVRAGGFAVVALDLADVPARTVASLPMATWMRIAHANEGRSTVCLLVGQAPMGRSARGASLALEGRPVWSGTSGQSQRFEGLQACVPASSRVSPSRHVLSEQRARAQEPARLFAR